MFGKICSKRTRRIVLVSLAVVIVGAAGTGLWANHRVQQGAAELIFEKPADVPEHSVGIVFGAKVWSTGPSHILEDRLSTAVDLYRLGKISKLLLSGDHGRNEYDEVNAMRDYALRNGVRPEDLFLDHAGFRTYDTLCRARDVFGVKQAVLITNRFHLPRALYVARQLGLDVVGCPSDKRVYQTRVQNNCREFLARTLAWMDVNVLHTRPKFLGPPIDIHGDGRATWDQKQ